MTIRRAALTAGFLVAVTLSALAAGDVLVLDLETDIGRGTVSYVRSGLDAAAESNAGLVVVRLATPGGLLDAAYAARDLLLGATVPTVAFVDREAFSAGALIALACNEIVFAPGGVMGAATALQFDLDGGYEEAPEKTQSAVRTLFRATAEARGRDPQVAEAMVDPDIEIPGLIEAGKLLTLSAQEAVTWGFSDGNSETLTALLDARGLAEANAIVFERRAVDTIAEAMTSTVLAAILLVVGLLGLIIEMMIPGFGVAGIVGALCLGAFFWSHFLVGLAGWESIAFVVGGLFAVILEIFVFTAADFGLAGIGGLVLIGLGFYSSMVGPLTDRAAALQAIGIVSVGVVVTLIIAAVLIARLPKSKLRLGGVILSSAITGTASSKASTRRTPSEWVGRVGVAATNLRPVGAGVFGDDRIDVVCEEGHLPKDTPIIIVKDQGYRKVVRKHIEEA